MGRFRGSTPDRSFWNRIFDHICQPIARAAKKARPKLATQAFSRFAKDGKQSVFHRNLGGDVGRHRFPLPRTLMKTALAPNGAKAVKTILWSGRRESNPRHQLGSVATFCTVLSTCENADALPAVFPSIASKKAMFYSSVNAILRLFCDQDCDQKGETWIPCYLRKRSPPIR